jgi:hypothetical protein
VAARGVSLVVTGVVTGVIVNLLTPAAQKEISPSSPPSGPPLTIVSEDPVFPLISGDWVFPTKVVLGISQLNLLDSLVRAESNASMSRYVQWFSSMGGYKSTAVATRVVLENNHSYPIRIMDMNVVKKCGPPLRGTVFIANGGAEDKIVGLGFSLDSTDTDAETAQGVGPTATYPG